MQLRRVNRQKEIVIVKMTRNIYNESITMCWNKGKGVLGAGAHPVYERKSHICGSSGEESTLSWQLNLEASPTMFWH